MELKPKNLKVFCSLIETGSVATTADQFALTPSAVSRIISDLEGTLSSGLFLREKKKLLPTKFALGFYRKSKEALRVWKTVEEFEEEGPGREPLRIAVLARHANPIIPALVSALKTQSKEFSNRRLHFDIHHHRDFYYSKISHPFDVGFGCLIGVHEDLEVKPVAHLPLYVWGKKGILDESSEEISPEKLSSSELILLPSDTKIGSYCRQALPHIKASDTVLTVSNTDAALAMAAQGLGFHVTDALAGSAGENLVCKRLKTPVTIPCSVFYPKSKSVSKEGATIIDTLRKVVGAKLRERV